MSLQHRFTGITNVLLVLISIHLASTAAETSSTSHATGKRGVVVAGGQAAVDAGLAILKDGGNAADAAVATILALSVTDSSLFCFGGEVPFLIYDAKRNVTEVVCGQGVAPRLATLEHFTKRGGIPTSGVEAATVPATLDACVTVLDRYGTKRFADCAAPTLKLLDKHQVPWHADLAKTIRTLIAAEQEAPHDRRRGLRLVADCFYRGSIARDLDAWSRANGGLIRYNDLATHTTQIEEPLAVDYRGYTVYKCGVWTQGPFVLQALQMLEGFDLQAIGPSKPETIHLTLEATKLAMADRDTYFADPHFSDVPVKELLSPGYAAARRGLIDREHASRQLLPGDPRQAKPLLKNVADKHGDGTTGHDTTTCLVADDQGNVIAATPSGWSGVQAGNTGVWLGSRLQSFNSWPGHINCIEPGKRPRITLTPTLVFKDKRPIYAISVAGGDGQGQATLQLLTNAIDFGLRPAEAVTAPRFGTDHFVGSFGQTKPKLGSLTLDSRFSKEIEKALAAKGHVVTRQKAPLWAPTMLFIDPKSGLLDGAGDPLAKRHAGAW